MNKKIIFFLMSVVFTGVLATSVARLWHPRATSSPAAAMIRAAASFYPLAEFAKQVGQDRVGVTNLTPAGAEPHDFDPSPQDIITLQNSRVFIYNGAGLEAWVDRVLPELQRRAVVTVNASQGIPLLSGIPEQSTDIQPSPDPHLTDPHFWLDPTLAAQEVNSIKEGLIKADPGQRDFYEVNAAAYQQKLGELDQEFSQGLAHCERQEIVTSHAAFGYLARHYHLTMISIAGLSPDAEPSPQRLAKIAEFARQHQVAYIFFETLVSPRLSETIAREVGAKTIVFNPLEGLSKEELAQGKNYLSIQRENLHNLKIALACR
jgi:zinc transport system substrate-binding protein